MGNIDFFIPLFYFLYCLFVFLPQSFHLSGIDLQFKNVLLHGRQFLQKTRQFPAIAF